MNVLRILIQEKQLIIELNKLDVNQELSFVLKNRNTDESVTLDAQKDIKNSRVILDYSQVQLPEVEFARYDLFLSTSDNKMIKPKIQNDRMSLKVINTDVFYFTSEQYGFRFYFTKNNTVAVGRGNYFNVQKEFKQLRKIEVPVETLSSSDGKISLETVLNDLSDKVFFAWKNEEEKFEKYTLQPVNTYKNSEGRSVIEVDQAAKEMITKFDNVTPLVMFIKESVLYEGILTTNSAPSVEQVKNELGIYFYGEESEVKITSDLVFYIESIMGAVKRNIIVKDYLISAGLLTIQLKESFNETDEVVLLKQYVANETLDDETIEPIVDFKISGSKIKIPLSQLGESEQNYRCLVIVKKASHVAQTIGANTESYQSLGLYNDQHYGTGLKSEKCCDYAELSEDCYLVPYWSDNAELIFKTVSSAGYREIRYDNKKVNFSFTNFKTTTGKIELQLEAAIFVPGNTVNFYLQERKTKSKVNLKFLTNDQQTVLLDFSDFLRKLEPSNSRWDLFVEIYQQESYLYGKLGLFSSNVRDKQERYLAPINDGKDGFDLTPYFSIKNELAFVWNTPDKIRSEKIGHTMQVLSSKVSHNNIRIEAEISDVGIPNFEIPACTLRLRNKAVDEEYELPMEILSKTDNKAVVSIEIDPRKYHLLPFYWDIYVILRVGQEDFSLKLKNPTKKVARDVTQKITKNEIDLDDGYMIYPYITMDNSYAICYRKKSWYENRFNRFKENLAYYTYHLFKKHFDKRKIWIGYEKEASVAQDNGYQFFNYCVKNNKKKNFYYVIKTDTKDYQDIKYQGKRILKFMSFRYMVYMFAAELMVSSESKGHSYDIRIQKGKLKDALQDKKFIFLQHGVTALKKVDYVFNKSKQNTVSLFTATSDFEKNIIKNNFGYDDSEIMLTGFARWDVLKDKSYKQEPKKIFVMPTWRSWMDGVPEKEFIESNYYKQYRQLLESKKLHDILEKNNITLHFLLHPKFIDYSDKFIIPGDRIQTHQFGEIKINEMLMESSLLITDYSSVVWEFFYMKKPVIFFQFDRNQYERFQGSYMDLEHDLFGDSATNVEELLGYVQYYIDNNFQEKTKFGVLRNKYFKYVDHNNSKRTFDAIRKFEKKLTNE